MEIASRRSISPARVGRDRGAELTPLGPIDLPRAGLATLLLALLPAFAGCIGSGSGEPSAATSGSHGSPNPAGATLGELFAVAEARAREWHPHALLRGADAYEVLHPEAAVDRGAAAMAPDVRIGDGRAPAWNFTFSVPEKRALNVTVEADGRIANVRDIPAERSRNETAEGLRWSVDSDEASQILAGEPPFARLAAALRDPMRVLGLYGWADNVLWLILAGEVRHSEDDGNETAVGLVDAGTGEVIFAGSLNEFLEAILLGTLNVEVPFASVDPCVDPTVDGEDSFSSRGNVTGPGASFRGEFAVEGPCYELDVRFCHNQGDTPVVPGGQMTFELRGPSGEVLLAAEPSHGPLAPISDRGCVSWSSRDAGLEVAPMGNYSYEVRLVEPGVRASLSLEIHQAENRAWAQGGD